MRRGSLVLAFAVITASPALALDLPARKAGLWDITMSVESAGSVPAQGMQQCIDAATDKLMNDMGGGMSRQVCSKQEVKTAGSTITVDSVCQVGNSSMTSQAVVTGDFNSAYNVKVTSQGGPSGGMKMNIDAKWLGACKADQKPGDIIMANGMKMNIVDMQKMMNAAPGMPGRGMAGQPAR